MCVRARTRRPTSSIDSATRARAGSLVEIEVSTRVLRRLIDDVRSPLGFYREPTDTRVAFHVKRRLFSLANIPTAETHAKAGGKKRFGRPGRERVCEACKPVVNRSARSSEETKSTPRRG